MYSPNSCRTALSFSVLSFFSTTILTAATRFSDIKKLPFPARGKKRVPRLVSNKSDSPLSRRAYPSAQVANIFKRHLPFGICLVFIINLSARKSKRYAHTFRYLCKYCGMKRFCYARSARRPSAARRISCTSTRRVSPAKPERPALYQIRRNKRHGLTPCLFLYVV